MIIVKHKFQDHIVAVETKILIVGTFNPAAEGNEASFFYSRSRNNLWKLLPLSYGEENLKDAEPSEKIKFIEKYKIDFVDLIEEVSVERGSETNYYDSYIDSRVTKWKNIQDLIDNLPELKKVCFSRKTFSGIPNMKERIEAIRIYAEKRGIYFEYLKTPARGYSVEKQKIWKSFLRD